MANELQGVAILARRLKGLKRQAAVSILRSAARFAMRPVLARARELVPVGTEAHVTYRGRKVEPGFARKSLKITTSTRRDGTVRASIGVTKEAFYATQFIEETGAYGRPARPWLRPAFRERQGQALTAFRVKMAERIARARKA